MKAANKYVLLLTLSILIACSIQAQIPKLNSDLAANATIFLDFDGQYVKGTSWNWSGPIDAQPSGLTNDAITEIFNRVSEDYRPFNLNITTDSTAYAAAPYNKRTRLIITSSSAWYGRAGGVAFVGCFSWGDETPAWIFSTLLGNNTKNVAEACSHEAGHTLGLQHQSSYDVNCSKIAEYSGGQGEGEIGWAPIMGVGYYKNVTTWHTGPNTAGCNIIQNDLSIIAGSTNDFGFRADDHGNDPANSTPVKFQGQAFLMNGLINKPDDRDVFKIQLNATTNLKLSAIPQNVGNGNQGANIDIKISILNAAQDTIGIYNPSTLLNAGIDTNLKSGTYYLVVKGIGNINHSDYGSLGFYSLNGTMYGALPVHQFLLKGNSNNGSDFLSWSMISDEKIKSIIIETSSDGTTFQPLVVLNDAARTFNYKPLNALNYYRLRAITLIDERSYYSNIMNLRNVNGTRPVRLLSNLVHDRILVSCNAIQHYELFDAGGKLLAKGRLVSGINSIDVTGAPSGILLMRLNNSVAAWTEKIIKD